MFFSTIVPVYNSDKHLRNCLDSILSQTFSDFEVIVINDGSSDSSKEILEFYSQKDARIKVYNFENSGVAIARQRGISLARGDYMLFIDSDDTIKPELLSNVYHTICKFNCPDIIRYQAQLINDEASKDHNRYNFTSYLNVPMNGIDALKLWTTPGKKYAVYWLFAFKRKAILTNIVSLPNLRCYEEIAMLPLIIAHAKQIVTIGYVGYNYTCDNSSSLTLALGKGKEHSRALDFLQACHYATRNFAKQSNISSSEIAFFTENYRNRLKEKFDSLPEILKKELAPLFRL